MITLILIWMISIFLLLAIIGGVFTIIKKGFNLPDFLTILALMFVFTVFATIALTGEFVIN